ncbi:E3 ubiquitin-protein ligase Mdm2-like isoform X2 [Homarus americanus]|uniref:E3 ubiquitin-protein ligase Mdm2-like isoform X2 n=1 Tax=Homarus americanus TaxID=6706 RepID=UPI001C43C3B2|nr:E3 ubiquitin-protein ligase Mdm2-like isoform X2 [Homarus americanus]
MFEGDFCCCWSYTQAISLQRSKTILTLLKTYLYSKRHLFDPNDILYVNCGNDPLGGALGVERFHFNEAKLLVARNILPVQSNPQKHISTCGPTWVKPLPVPASGSSTQERLIDCDSRNDVKYSHVPTARIDTRLELDNANDKTAVPSSDNCLPTTSKTSELGSSAGTCLDLKISQDMQASLSTSPVAGPSRLTAEETASYSKGCPTSGFPSRLVIPSVPESGTDSESAYSCQGYETALCHNTEYEETDVTNNEEEEDQEHSEDGDDDSIIEDVGVAVLAFHALYESERDFWPDSDTEDESTDDPELVGERWPCLSCGQKNKPFVRYCSKCWHLRKNWLPERPKKCRRRKPRFKNKHKKHKTEAEVPDEQVPTPNRASGNLSKDLENSNSHPPFKDNEQRQSTSDPSVCSSLSAESTAPSVCSSLSAESTDPSVCSSLSAESSEPSTSSTFEHYGSQDSGIFLSQGSLTDLSQEVEDDDDLPDVYPSIQSTSTLQTYTKGKSLIRSLGSYQDFSNKLQIEKSPHCQVTATSNSLEGKSERVRMHIGSVKPSNMSKTKNVKELKAQVKHVSRFLSTKAGKEWLSSANGKEFQSSHTLQEVLRDAEQASSSNNCKFSKLSHLNHWASRLCPLCHLRPKNASIIHGRLSHQATCYQCAQRLLDRGSRCPVCHRKIHMVCKHIIA